MRPLDGCRVIDLSNYITGAFASLHLADLGADVVKVESPKRGPYRRFGFKRAGISVGFANINRGKRSVVLDLATEGDRSQLLGLVREADVVLSNWRPGVAESLGLTDEALW